AGFDEKEAVAAVGLEHIKFIKKPEPPPVVALPPPPEAPQPQQPKSSKAAAVEEQARHVLDLASKRAAERMTRFFTEQRRRVEQAWQKLPPTKAARAAKSDPDWWDAATEDAELTATMRAIYVDVGQGGLQAVADNLDRTIV